MPTRIGVDVLSRQWSCDICKSSHKTKEDAFDCEAECKAKQIEKSLADRIPLHTTEERLDHEENNPAVARPVTGDVDWPTVVPKPPLVNSLAYVPEAIERMIDVLMSCNQTELTHNAVQDGQHAVGICNGILTLDATEPSRIDQDAERAQKLIEKAGGMMDEIKKGDRVLVPGIILSDAPVKGSHDVKVNADGSWFSGWVDAKSCIPIGDASLPNQTVTAAMDKANEKERA